MKLLKLLFVMLFTVAALAFLATLPNSVAGFDDTSSRRGGWWILPAWRGTCGRSTQGRAYCDHCLGVPP